LNSFIENSESYKTENFGSAEGGAKAGTWSGYMQRNLSGVNAFGDYVDEYDTRHYETQYMQLNQQTELNEFDNGIPSNLNEYYQGKPQNPFMPKLIDGLNVEDGYDFYDSRSESFKHVHKSREKAMNYVNEQLQNTPGMLRKVVNQYLKRNPSDKMSLEEAVSNPDIVNQARLSYIESAGSAWDDRFSEEALSREDELFTGGFVTPEGMKVEVPGSGYIDEADTARVSGRSTDSLLENLGKRDQAVSDLKTPLETVGFDMLNQLKEPIDASFTGELGEKERITAVQVDRNGKIHVSLESLVPAEGVAGSGFESTDVKTNSAAVYDENDPMHKSIRNYLGEEVYRDMWSKSESVSKSQRASRIQEAFDNATVKYSSSQAATDREAEDSPMRSAGANIVRPEGLGVVTGDYTDSFDDLGVGATQEEIDAAKQSEVYSSSLKESGWNPSLEEVRKGNPFGLRTLISGALDTVAGPLGWESDVKKNRGKERDALISAVMANRENIPPVETFAGQPSTSGIENVGKPTSQKSLYGSLSPRQREAYDDNGGVAVLTNNPGNLRPYEGYEGEVYYNKDNKKDAFQVFDTPREGLEALKQDLSVKVSGRGVIGEKLTEGTLPSGARSLEEVTIFDLISVYAPVNENNSEGYSNTVAKFFKDKGIEEFTPDSLVKGVDLDLLAEAIVKVESGPNYRLLVDLGLFEV